MPSLMTSLTIYAVLMDRLIMRRMQYFLSLIFNNFSVNNFSVKLNRPLHCLRVTGERENAGGLSLVCDETWQLLVWRSHL